MTKYKADIADTTASLLSLPDDLEGLVKQVGGVTEVGSNEQKKLEPPSQAENKPQSTSEKKPKTRAKKKERPKLNVEGDDLWNSFVSGCDEEETISKVVGRNGNASWCMVDKTILNACRQCSVNGHGVNDMVNAILRKFILHYRTQLQHYKTKEDSLI